MLDIFKPRGDLFSVADVPRCAHKKRRRFTSFVRSLGEHCCDGHIHSVVIFKTKKVVNIAFFFLLSPSSSL